MPDQPITCRLAAPLHCTAARRNTASLVHPHTFQGDWKGFAKRQRQWGAKPAPPLLGRTLSGSNLVTHVVDDGGDKAVGLLGQFLAERSGAAKADARDPAGVEAEVDGGSGEGGRVSGTAGDAVNAHARTQPSL